MTTAPSLHWLPETEDWRPQLSALRAMPPSLESWNTAIALANTRLDFVRTNALDAAVRELFGDTPPDGLAAKPVRLAVLGSSTLAHLHAGLRVAALRRGIPLVTYENEYGQYRGELLDAASGLHAFRPSAVLFAFDCHHLAAGLHAGMSAAGAEAALERVREEMLLCWRAAREAFRCPVLQQTALPALPELIGGNEHRLAGSRAGCIARINAMLPSLADAEGVDLVRLDARAARDGIAAWHDAVLWARAKQEVAVAAGPVYGELAIRPIAARQGRSAKALVLDLDNTIWGGVIGDDGLEGIVLGQGSALGEGFLAVQRYALEQSRRGVILAVCSKNDEANAAEAFDRHPEMLLRRDHVASFVLNWNDKAANLRIVAEELNIGLDALVFVDDNPFERTLVRRELPMVLVPEVPADPALVPQALADAGYFEAVAITEDDRRRSQQYQGNRARAALAASATDMQGYLRSLEMQLLWRRFDRVGLPRIVQLINKTNQFNLTTRRYTAEEALAVIGDARALGLQLRLLDRFGDNGVIAVVIGRLDDDGDLQIDTWLMSCRVLGREVEAATLNLLAAQACALGARRLVGEYRQTPKNGMVRDHYARLGFVALTETTSVLELERFAPLANCIETREG
ncbi:MAG: HAD family hydrolase [Acidisphaera sp.]|nr:HAD family hydrolase [Acidisphaera sp.]